jgi:hypothetical protein
VSLMAVPHIVVRSPSLPADRLIYEGIDTSYGPLFSVGDVARIFLRNQTAWWLRRREASLTVGDKPWQPQRTHSGARVYELSDIELLLHALCESGFIAPDVMHHGLMVAMWLGYLHGYLEERK